MCIRDRHYYDATCPLVSKIHREVENFEETLEVLKESDWKIVIGPGERMDGQKFVYILDDDNNMLEFTTNNYIKHVDRITDELGYSKNKDIKK